MTSLKKRIAELFHDQPEKKPAHLARALNISRSSVSAWMTGQTRTIQGDNAFGVAKFFGCNPEWVQSGKGKKYPSQEQSALSPQVHGELQFLPLVPFDLLSKWGRDMNAVIKDVTEFLPCPPASCSSNAFAVRVVDDSMTSPFPGQRSYTMGAVLYIDPDKEATPGRRVIATLFGDAVFREYRKDGGKLILTAFNPQYQAHDVTSDMQILGVVIGQYLAD